MKPKVLQLIGNLHAAGSERQAMQLAQALQESSRYEVIVACMDPEGDMRSELNQLGFNEIPEFPLKSFYHPSTIRQLARFVNFIRKHNIAIVQTHDFYTNIFGMTGAWLAGVPARIAARRETTGWRTTAQKFVERRAYKLSHAIVSNAEAVSQQLLTEGVRKNKIVTIYNGLRLERIIPKYNRQETLELLNLPLNGHCRFVTIVANLLHPVKDHPTFLRAAQRVRQTVPEARFVLAGEGPLIAPMKALAKELGLEQDVFFTGRCDYVADLLSISDVCVLSSKAEGFSNSILEYMGAGRPVVATDVGGAREAIIEGESGYVVEPGNHELMADRIIELLLDRNRAQAMGQRGQQVVKQNFTPQARLAKTEQLYHQLLSRGKSPVPLLSRLFNLGSSVLLISNIP